MMAPNFSAILFDNSNNPETVYLKRAFSGKPYRRLCRKLPEEQKAVFVWNELGDIPFKEIAETYW